MELPVRCFSCNKVLGQLWKPIESLRATNTPPTEIATKLRLVRECCKYVVLTAIASVGEEYYEPSTGVPVPISDIGIDRIDTRCRDNTVVTQHQAV